jgi:hypothetical protein
LRHFYREWEKVTNDQVILDIIKNGVKLEFHKRPPFNLPISSTLEKPLEIEKLLQCQAIEEASDLTKGFHSRSFQVIKPEKIRTVIDLKGLNQSIVNHTFTMNTLDKTLKLVTKRSWLTKIDLSSAYHHIPIFKHHRKFLRFTIGNSTYQYKVLPFGLSSAPRIFTKIMRVVMQQIHKLGIVASDYLDDLLIISQSEAKAERNTRTVLKLLTSLGFEINRKKSSLIPSNQVEYLGFLIDSRKMRLFIPSKKITRLASVIRNFTKAKRVSLRKTARVLGKLQHVGTGTFGDRVMTRALLRLKNAMLKEGDWKTNPSMKIPPEVHRELQTWLQILSSNKGKPLIIRTPSLTITTDASSTGWGATLYKGKKLISRCYDLWDTHHTTISSNKREILASILAINKFRPLTKSRNLILETDNATNVSYWLKMGGKVGKLSRMVEPTLQYLRRKFITIFPQFVKGTEMVKEREADFLSRVSSLRNELQLNPTIFKRISRILGPHPIDLFANSQNTQCKKYRSWAYDNTFHHKWFNGYAFPPIKLIPATIQKVWQDKASITIIIPYWPNQPWFPWIMRSLVQYPIRLISERLFKFKERFLPAPLNTQYLAMKISGESTKQREFRKSIRLHSSSLSARRLNPPTLPTGNNMLNSAIPIAGIPTFLLRTD